MFPLRTPPRPTVAADTSPRSADPAVDGAGAPAAAPSAPLTRATVPGLVQTRERAQAKAGKGKRTRAKLKQVRGQLAEMALRHRGDGSAAKAENPPEPPRLDPAQHLPGEIMIQALKHLDAPSLAKAGQVSRKWNAAAAGAFQGLRLESPADLARFARPGPAGEPGAAERLSAGGMDHIELGAGHYTVDDLEQLPAALKQSLKRLELGDDATFSPQAWDKIAKLPSLRTVSLGRGALADDGAGIIAKLNGMHGLQSIEARLRSPEDFDAVAASTKPLHLSVDGRSSNDAGDTDVLDEDLAKLPPSTASLTFTKPLVNVTASGWAALNELPGLRSLRAAARDPRQLAALAGSEKLTALDIGSGGSPHVTNLLTDAHLARLPDSLQELTFHTPQHLLTANFWKSLDSRPALGRVNAVASRRSELHDLVNCSKLKSLEFKTPITNYDGGVSGLLIAALPRGLEELSVKRHLPGVGAGVWLAMNDRPALRKLEIVGQTREELAALSASTKITGLDLSQMDDYGDEDLANLPPAVRKLALGAPGHAGSLTPAGIARLRETHPKLDDVELHAGLAALPAASALFGPSGIVTGLTVHEIPAHTNLTPAHLPDLPSSLRKLRLHPQVGQEMLAVTPETVRSWHALPLQHLDIQHLRVDSEAALALARHPTLRSLKLNQNALTDQEALCLATSRSLRNLDLSYNLLGDSGVTALMNNARLKSLDLGTNLRVTRGMRAQSTFDRPVNLDSFTLG